MSEKFEQTLKDCFGERIKTDDEFCCQLWSSLANVDWHSVNEYDVAAYSFRAAGGLIAKLRGSGSYLDWYCCGPYSTITDEIQRTLRKAGWIPNDQPPVCDEPGCLSDAGCGWQSPSGYRSTCGKHLKN